MKFHRADLLQVSILLYSYFGITSAGFPDKCRGKSTGSATVVGLKDRQGGYRGCTRKTTYSLLLGCLPLNLFQKIFSGDLLQVCR